MLPHNLHQNTDYLKLMNVFSTNQFNNTMNIASLGTLPFNISSDNMNPNVANMNLIQNIINNTSHFPGFIPPKIPTLFSINSFQNTCSPIGNEMNSMNSNYFTSSPLTPSSTGPSSSQPSSSSSASLSSSIPICKICGGQCRSKKGVGSSICKSCREFFRTAVLNDYTFRCARIGRCDVDVDKIKKYQQCRACRMKKLLEFGLDPKDVIKNQRIKRPKEIKTPEQKQPEPFCFTVPTVAEEPPRKKFGTDPILQFANIRDCTKSFLLEVLDWPKRNELFRELEEEQKIQLLHSQWIFISFLTSCENGAHLLDLNEEMCNVAHDFNAMNLSSYEIRAMKSVLLFMMKEPDGTFYYQNNLDDSLEDLDRAVGPDSDRFANILLLLGTVIWLPLAGVEKMFKATVVELIPEHV